MVNIKLVEFQVMEPTTEFMQRLDREYQEKSGLSERRFYSIFYSQVIPSRLLIIGFNTGGDPDTWEESSLASQTFYENGEHEYVDCDYPIAVAMRTFLRDVLTLPTDDRLRNIPKTNLIFRRSRSMDGIRISERDAILEAKPILAEIIRRVAPEIILCEGISTLEKFEEYYCRSVEEQVDGVRISTPNGRYPARIYRADRASLADTQSPLKLVGVGHPSKYSG